MLPRKTASCSSDDPNGSEHEKSLYLKLYMSTKSLKHQMLAISPAQSLFLSFSTLLVRCGFREKGES